MYDATTPGASRPPAARPLPIVLTLLLAVVASTAHAAPRAATADPAGDTFGTGDAPIDATYFAARTTDEELLLDLAFAGDVAPPSSAAGNAVVGFVDLDVDADAGTGGLPFVDFLTDFESGLGTDFHLDLLSYDPADGTVAVVGGGGAVAGRVPMTVGPNALGVRVPLALLGSTPGGPAVRTAAVVGTAAEATDAVPDGGFLEATAREGEGVLLNGDRFSVEVGWRNFEGDTGSGQLVFRSDDSAVFWFFAEANWELMVKVIDGCAFNQRYWVFAAATTNVEYTVTVTDTATGAVRVYQNPLGTAAAAVNDTDAFATCP